MKTFTLSVFSALLTFACAANVHLYRMPAGLSIADVQKFIHSRKTVWIDHSTDVGNLILGKSGYYIMMAGRTNVVITGNIINRGNNFVGNGDVTGTIVNEKGYLKLNCVNVNVPKDKIGIEVQGGKVTAQMCRAVSGKNCLLVRNKGELEVFGGNYRSSSECHIKQVDNGHLHIFGAGFQLSQGTDIEITGASWKGCHFIESCRSESGNLENSAMIYVPPGNETVNVYMRANTLASVKPMIVSYNAKGTLCVTGNCNYSNEGSGSKQPSLLATRGKVVSIGNNYGNTLDSNTFQIERDAVMESIGDMTRIDRKEEPHTITIEKTKPYKNVKYVTRPKESIPEIPVIQPLGFEPISNIPELGIARVEQYGASVQSVDNSSAITAALQANKLVLLSGLYRVTRPIQISGHLGGGLWGIGAGRCGIISTAGTGCINVESMGYSHFRDFSLIIRDTASNAVNFNFGWLNNASSRGGSALQNTAFYNLVIENGGIGLKIGDKLMGSELWIANCTFIQKKLRKGTATQLDNYNALSDNFVHCNFSGWDVAVRLQKGYGNILSSTFNNIGTVLYLGSQVGNGILVSNSTFNAACDNAVITNNSSARTAIIFDKIKFGYSDVKKDAGVYRQGGTVVVQNSDFGKRALLLNGGIGQKVLIPDTKSKSSFSVVNEELSKYGFDINYRAPPSHLSLKKGKQ